VVWDGLSGIRSGRLGDRGRGIRCILYKENIEEGRRSHGFEPCEESASGVR
jgi:hypothetical protein